MFLFFYLFILWKKSLPELLTPGMNGILKGLQTWKAII